MGGSSNQHEWLISTYEIKKLYGLDRQQVFRLLAQGDFPKPVAEMGIGRVWLAEDVEQAIIEMHESGRLREDGRLVPRYLLT